MPLTDPQIPTPSTRNCIFPLQKRQVAHPVYVMQVPVSRSIDLMAAFKEEGRESFEHSGGHMVPTCTGEFKAFMLDFLDRMEQQVVGPLGQT